MNQMVDMGQAVPAARGLREARAFAPASVANVAVGFDLLGYPLDGVGDTVTVRRIDAPVVRIAAIRGTTVALPLEAERNTAGAALMSLRAALALPFGFELEIDKGIALSSGMGGSAASCVAALVAANALLDTPVSTDQLYQHALDGEAVASGSRHGDNLGPLFLGGLVLCTLERLVPIAVPEAWHSLVVHPEAVLETRRAREALAGDYRLSEFVAQSTNLALVLAGCHAGDADLVRAGLRDVLIEPRRAPLIAGFAQAKQAALAHAALGASISGAGPSVFAWFETRAAAVAAAPAVQAAFAGVGLDSQAWVTPINSPAARLLA
ncbi:homoserine kinase [Xanthomonas campestris]|uniref:homoserine kinase n=1 Tax=Xanthomonas campestris TaxID=339 RepID=UPI0009BFF99B|nr:homoserine kinase [Xanthomonas campestris]MEB1150577.1 homoserine kinase [Xanthomonas campestris pv. campestris]MCC5097213.1 homoserine kinase [Xanthomonas campestris]MEA9583121.1 homoserine kinase [Xanthomonas campestris]MEA9591424.1 homoserine kinase [Xanthomonas campestris]MEA9623017.1 homoserine kinase [Xanthomonas campestris]